MPLQFQLLHLQAKHILLPVAGLLAIGLYAQSRAAKFLNFFIDSVAFAFDQAQPVLRLNIMVQNPSNEQFVIRSITGNAYLGETKAGSFSMFQTITIPPNNQQLVPLYVRLLPSGIVSEFIRMIQLGGNPMTVRLQGFVNANGFVNELALDYKV